MQVRATAPPNPHISLEIRVAERAVSRCRMPQSLEAPKPTLVNQKCRASTRSTGRRSPSSLGPRADLRK